MRIQHGTAARDVAEKQNCKHDKQKQRRPQLSRSEIRPGVHEINRDATYKNSPATSVCPVPAKESSKTERKHVRQRPILAAGIRREERRQPRHNISDNLIS
jgi:hypothetical protein